MSRPSVEVRFYAELNDLLPAQRRFRAISVPVQRGQTVKDLVESLRVPHTEVDLVLVDGESVTWEHRLEVGVRIAVYPVFEALDISPLVRLRPAPLRDPRFVLDGHLGRLARRLRLFGFDSLYRPDYSDDELEAISLEEHRILLTRDRGLLMRKTITHGHLVRATVPDVQALEVVRRFDLSQALRPFSRCVLCNGMLRDVKKVDVAGALPAFTREHFDAFRSCQSCEKVYWKGAHFPRLLHLVEEARRLSPF